MTTISGLKPQSTRPARATGGAYDSPPPLEPGVEYCRVERVARYLDVSNKRVYQLVQERRLRAVRLGPRQMRIARDSIEEYVKELMTEEDM